MSDWIPIESRPMTEEERKEYNEETGYNLNADEAIIYCGRLPDDGQEVLIYSKYGGVLIDTFCSDTEGCYFDCHGDMDGITHWMPLPEPPKEEDNG